MMIGLGVGIDYALFIVTRHRQHLHEGMQPDDAAGQATATAGQSVLFAGTTVVIAICGLLLAGIPPITAMGFAIGITVIVSMLIAVTLLPALLGLAGTAIDSLADPPQEGRRRRPPDPLGQVGAPRRQPAVALRRRSASAVLVVAAAPVLGMRIGFADDSNEAEGSTARESYELLAESFGPGFIGHAERRHRAPGRRHRRRPSRCATRSPPTEGVAAVERPDRSARPATPPIISIIPTSSPQDEATSELVEHASAPTCCPAATDGTGADDLPDRPDRLPGGPVRPARRAAADLHAGGRRPVVRAADDRLPVGLRAAQGGDHEPAVDRCRLRRDHRRVPVGLGQGPRRPRGHRPGQPVHPADHVRHPVRPLDGLRGVPPQPGP